MPTPRFRILGTVEFDAGGGWSTVAATKQRALLAVLLLHAGQVVPAERLATELWPERIPDRAAGLLAGYVWRLRGALGPEGRKLLVTRAPGYRLTVPDGALDVPAYEALVADGRARQAAGDLLGATGRYEAALALWRGDPLAGVPRTATVAAEVARLEESRVSIQEARIGTAIGLGRHEEVLPELKLLVSQHPLRERLHADLMLALHRCGQQADALGAYADLRRLLVGELGIEPSRPLRELQQRILAEDASLLAPERVAPERAAAAPERVVAAPRPAVAVRALPPPDPLFAGRAGPLAELTARLGRVAVCAVHGMAGCGKTALARQAAAAAADRFPDGRFWLDLGGSAPAGPVTAAQAVRALLAELDGSAGPVPADPGAVATRWTGALAGRRVLVVLDDVVAAEQVRLLLGVPAGCTVLVCGRPALPVGTGDARLQLGLLPVAGCGQLLTRALGPSRTTDRAAVADVVRLCEQLPLALRAAADWLAARPGWSPRDYAAALADPARRLDLLAAGPADVRAALAAGVRLAGRTTPAAGALPLLGLLDLPLVDTAAAAALLGVGVPAARAALDGLVAAGLAEPLAADRYRVLELVRLYAREQGDPPGGGAALRRVLDHYSGQLADRLDRLDRLDKGDVAATAAWLRAELPTIRRLAPRDGTGLLGAAAGRLGAALRSPHGPADLPVAGRSIAGPSPADRRYIAPADAAGDPPGGGRPDRWRRT